MSSIQVKKFRDYVLCTLLDKVFIRNQVEDFHSEIKKIEHPTQKKYILDFSRCEYVSSEGLGTLAEFWSSCEDKKACMCLILSEKKENEVAYLFDIIGLSKLMAGHIFYDLETAKQFVKQQSN